MRAYRADPPRPRAQHPRVCERCGEIFTAARSDARYCSAACRAAAQRNRHIWAHDPDGYGQPCHSQIFGTGCTAVATWRHAMAPTPHLVTFWCKRHKSIAAGRPDLETPTRPHPGSAWARLTPATPPRGPCSSR
jgi:hypothetical protein